MFDNSRARKLVTALVIACMMVLPLVALAGCSGGGNTPEGAVQKFLNAWQSGNWEAFKASVTPAKRNLTKVQETLAKQKFQQVQVKFDGIKMATAVNKDDANKATVTLTNGKVTYTAEILGKKKTDTQDIGKDDPATRPKYDTLKVNGVWLVDTNLG